jgi:hypothetical protein
MTSEGMDSGSRFSDTARVAMTTKGPPRGRQNEKLVVRSVVVVLSFSTLPALRIAAASLMLPLAHRPVRRRRVEDHLQIRPV